MLLAKYRCWKTPHQSNLSSSGWKKNPGSIKLQNFSTFHCETSHNERAGGVAQVVEHLPSKCEAVSSNPFTTTNKKEVTF
jgi:hypothetical protein